MGIYFAFTTGSNSKQEHRDAPQICEGSTWNRWSGHKESPAVATGDSSINKSEENIFTGTIPEYVKAQEMK